jgi:hypothetical protein
MLLFRLYYISHLYQVYQLLQFPFLLGTIWIGRCYTVDISDTVHSDDTSDIKKEYYMAEIIQAKEYQDFMALREQMKKGIEEADSDFMLITYTQLLNVLRKLENKHIAQVKKTKKEALSKSRESA